ncbi:hypothetical protein HIM_02465 [Hirsutella minnesotensis 3608]|nr:hypothetical protein HIM_02465 [Hirsutella minnesotensis 3608]
MISKVVVFLSLAAPVVNATPHTPCLNSLSTATLSLGEQAAKHPRTVCGDKSFGRAQLADVCIPDEERGMLSPQQQIEKLCFQCSLSQFDSEWDSPFRSPGFPWWTDGCTLAPDQPAGFNLTESCRRHDFCYHALYDLGLFYENVKKEVDAVFKRDIEATCRAQDTQSKTRAATFDVDKRHVNQCEHISALYHIAVHFFGHLETPVKSQGSHEFVVKDGTMRQLDSRLKHVPSFLKSLYATWLSPYKEAREDDSP